MIPGKGPLCRAIVEAIALKHEIYFRRHPRVSMETLPWVDIVLRCKFADLLRIQDEHRSMLVRHTRDASDCKLPRQGNNISQGRCCNANQRFRGLGSERAVYFAAKPSTATFVTHMFIKERNFLRVPEQDSKVAESVFWHVVRSWCKDLMIDLLAVRGFHRFLVNEEVHLPESCTCKYFSAVRRTFEL